MPAQPDEEANEASGNLCCTSLGGARARRNAWLAARLPARSRPLSLVSTLQAPSSEGESPAAQMGSGWESRTVPGPTGTRGKVHAPASHSANGFIIIRPAAINTEGQHGAQKRWVLGRLSTTRCHKGMRGAWLPVPCTCNSK